MTIESDLTELAKIIQNPISLTEVQQLRHQQNISVKVWSLANLYLRDNIPAKYFDKIIKNYHIPGDPTDPMTIARMFLSLDEFYPNCKLRNDQIRAVYPQLQGDSWIYFQNATREIVNNFNEDLSVLQPENLPQLLQYAILRGYDLRSFHAGAEQLYQMFHLDAMIPKKPYRITSSMLILENSTVSYEQQVNLAFQGFYAPNAPEEMQEIVYYPPAGTPSDYLEIKYHWEKQTPALTWLIDYRGYPNDLFFLTRGYSA